MGSQIVPNHMLWIALMANKYPVLVAEGQSYWKKQDFDHCLTLEAQKHKYTGQCIPVSTKVNDYPLLVNSQQKLDSMVCSTGPLKEKKKK